MKAWFFRLEYTHTALFSAPHATPSPTLKRNTAHTMRTAAAPSMTLGPMTTVRCFSRPLAPAQTVGPDPSSSLVLPALCPISRVSPIARDILTLACPVPTTAPRASGHPTSTLASLYGFVPRLSLSLSLTLPSCVTASRYRKPPCCWPGYPCCWPGYPCCWPG